MPSSSPSSKKVRLLITHIPGETLARSVNELMATTPDVLAAVEKLMQ